MGGEQAKAICSRLLDGIKFCPFIGRLSYCSRDEISDAIIEVVVATIFSTMPLWLLPLLSHAIFKVAVSAWEGIRTGELFLLSAALVGPLIYIITKGYGVRNSDSVSGHPLKLYSIRFPYGAGFIFVCFAICILSSFAFFVLRNPLFSQNELSTFIDYNSVANVSIITFLFSTLIFFCATAYRNSMDHPAAQMAKSENDFVRKWEDQK
ncbi:hypothetical protein ACELLULO517_17035 [Acidisoma cellulosilytica]|uniref:Uncharacterized protein n=1 Tax=Acidisoma cellulosilyticum TaxID=2802395 RepID=A0A963Z4W0_9PROT|nr:hypothetical protein [Acidisoma cellulosilyticum]MCB8881952.1 hypothetical protein [Acidisoma cellulosilyticum]